MSFCQVALEPHFQVSPVTEPVVGILLPFLLYISAIPVIGECEFGGVVFDDFSIGYRRSCRDFERASENSKA